MRKWATMAAGLAMLVTGTCAQAAQPSEQQVRKLLEAVGVGRMLGQMNGQVGAMMRQSLPCVPADYWQNFVDASATQQFIDRLVPVYQRHFSAEDIDGLVRFYSTPLGQKVITEMPVATAEAAQLGQQWGNQRRAQLVDQLKQKGTLDSSGQCPGTGSGAASGAVPDEDDAAAAEPTPVVKPAAKPAVRHVAKPASKSKAKPASKSAPKTNTKTNKQKKPPSHSTSSGQSSSQPSS